MKLNEKRSSLILPKTNKICCRRANTIHQNSNEQNYLIEHSADLIHSISNKMKIKFFENPKKMENLFRYSYARARSRSSHGISTTNRNWSIIRKNTEVLSDSDSDDSCFILQLQDILLSEDEAGDIQFQHPPSLALISLFVIFINFTHWTRCQAIYLHWNQLGNCTDNDIAVNIFIFVVRGPTSLFIICY